MGKRNIYTDISQNTYKASITREQFLFFETRETVKLVLIGLSDAEVIDKICEENLFQYPTEKSVRRMAALCLARLHAMNDETLIEAMATLPADEAKQICLYAMMKHSRLIRDFMVTVAGNKFRQQDLSFSKTDLNAFFMYLQEQNSTAASWSDSTVTRIKQVIMNVLVVNGYLDSSKATRLNPVLLGKVLESAIRANGDLAMLVAFNCFY